MLEQTRGSDYCLVIGNPKKESTGFPPKTFDAGCYSKVDCVSREVEQGSETLSLATSANADSPPFPLRPQHSRNALLAANLPRTEQYTRTSLFHPRHSLITIYTHTTTPTSKRPLLQTTLLDQLGSCIDDVRYHNNITTAAAAALTSAQSLPGSSGACHEHASRTSAPIDSSFYTSTSILQ
ncbi:hypothetical protein D0867_04406 [Hortaea werneckii]|uniref:Uncharacterized protein n=1 Tax=Hortaea werneckii TaxID=91943 RepID=A0A3M6YG36_HORWE|nr:hypothetical protein D0868_08200 [Hortaea werneckii]RMY19873.1 hypothetical protein D0867_04406 [Hortaea werneckii]